MWVVWASNGWTDSAEERKAIGCNFSKDVYRHHESKDEVYSWSPRAEVEWRWRVMRNKDIKKKR
jgi:hypothetical protein